MYKVSACPVQGWKILLLPQMMPLIRSKATLSETNKPVHMMYTWYSFYQKVFKVHLTPKYFFCSNKSLHLFKAHCAFLPLFNPNLDFLQAVKVTKFGHHLLHDQASKGYGSIPRLTSQTSLHACLQRLNMMQISLWHQTRNRPMPFTSSVVWQMMARFHNFYNLKKSQDLV